MTPIDTSALSAARAGTTADASPSRTKTSEASGGADRFLKMLVAQMKNQDPLNPMDNAEVTSQMAQISTVTGIEKLNDTILTMNGGFSALQSMQSAALVGRGVLVAGSRLAFDDKGNSGGGFELDAEAEKVRVDILSSSGAVLDSVELGARGAGRHSFDWKLKPGLNPEQVSGFNVVAIAKGQAVGATALQRDSVRSVVANGGQITVELASGGTLPYAQIKAFN